MSDPPSTNGTQTERDQRGRFAKGNSGGPGNPFANDVGKLRARLYRVLRGKDVDQAIKTIREIMGKGKDSDRLTAARLLLDRALGPSEAVDVLQELAELRAAVDSLLERSGL